METEFKRILDCMSRSDIIADGEYYVIHSDHIHDLSRAIEYYFEEDKKIEKLYGIVNPREGTQRLPNNEELMYKINEIIDKINRMER